MTLIETFYEFIKIVRLWPKLEQPLKTSMESKERFKRVVWKIGGLHLIDPGSYLKGIEICKYFHNHDVFTTLGKFSKNGIDLPETIVDECRQCSHALANSGDSNFFYLSIKPPALEFSLEHVKNIATAAFDNGHAIHFDSHDYSLADETLRLLKKSMNHFGQAHANNANWVWGLTLPSRWKRSFADMRWAVKNRVRVRLVKGEFRASNPSDEVDPGQGFLDLIDNMAGNVPELAVATHDCKLAREAICRARKRGTQVQLELLFGMPSAEMAALSKEMKVPLRVYVPYGETLLLYGIRHFLMNPYKFFRPNLTEIFSNHNSKIATILNTS